MQFDRLRLTGFKSFVDPTDLLIREGLTGVVGPNGCGKSNLLEAIRWVMGEASAKSLRGGGMEDVIFAGTATRSARDFAEVSLLIEQPGDGESEVTRRIERGAGSAYRIDGRDVRQKDVSLLFADAATGAHSPALVSQGRIGAVIAGFMGVLLILRPGGEVFGLWAIAAVGAVAVVAAVATVAAAAAVAAAPPSEPAAAVEAAAAR